MNYEYGIDEQVRPKRIPTLDEIQKVREELTALDSFLKSPAHAAYKKGKQKEVAALATQILDLDITSIEGLLLTLQQKGEYKAAVESITQFETARADLKQRLDDMVDAETSARQVSTHATS